MNSAVRFMHWSNRPECDASMEKYFEGYYTLQFITRGAVQLAYDEDLLTVGACAFWFHFPGPKVRLRPSGNPTWHHRHIAFTGKLADAWHESGLIADRPQHCPGERRTEFGAKFDDLLEWLGRGGSINENKARCALELLLWELREMRLAPATHGDLTDALAQFAQAHEFHVGDYTALAKSLGMSLSTLRRRILEATGDSLHDYTRKLRFNECRRLLATQSTPLAVIAEKTGFPDAYYFSREFKKFAGIPPGAYRRSLF